jgi:hypothetical protein
MHTKPDSVAVSSAGWQGVRLKARRDMPLVSHAPPAAPPPQQQQTQRALVVIAARTVTLLL